MRLHPWLVLVPVLLVATGVDAAPEPNVDDTHGIPITTMARVPVLVYTTVPDLAADDERLALDVAEEALSTASVTVDWKVCAPGACLTPVPAALKIRIVVSPDAAAADSNVLGHALIDSQTGSGVLATVFIDRTRRLAGELSIDHRVLLGRTIAHELGHLLLATPTHGTGLMRERWLRDELLGTRRDDWTFTPLDAAAIQKRLTSAAGGSRRGAS